MYTVYCTYIIYKHCYTLYIVVIDKHCYGSTMLGARVLILLHQDIPSEQFNCELEFFGLVSTMEEVNFQAAEELAQVDIVSPKLITCRYC